MKQIFEKVWKVTCFSGLAFLWIVTFIYPQFSKAYVASDLGNGILELKSRAHEGFSITSVARPQSSHRARSKVYFCIVKKDQVYERCFYGPRNELQKIKVGVKIAELQYKLAGRIYNDKNQISIGSGRYFYSIKKIRPSA